MTEHAWLLANTAIAITGIVVVITWLKFPPVFALLVGTIYLGLTTKVGPRGTPEAISGGFADVMADIGVLVAFGVILGALLTVTNTMQRLVEATLKVFGQRTVPYVFATMLSSMFTSIYSDVLLVLSAPMARRLGRRMGPRGIAMMGGALTAGIEVGLVFVAPGVAAVAIAGILGVPLGQMFVFGLLVGLPTALLTMLVFATILRFLKWDENDLAAIGEHFHDEPIADSDPRSNGGSAAIPAAVTGAPPAPRQSPGGAAETMVITDAPNTKREDNERTRAPQKELPLFVSVSPVLLTLLLIAGGALADALSADSPWVSFLTDPITAIFSGASLAYFLASRVRTREQITDAIGSALTSCGPILVLSGISGSLGFVIEGSGMAEVLGSAFSSGFLPPLLLVWIVAAVLHIALGSISVAGITAAGILAPIAGNLDAPLVLVALAAGSGALFLPHVSSNFFWMFQSLLGLSTRGAIKAHSIPMTLASVISLPLILLVSLFA